MPSTQPPAAGGLSSRGWLSGFRTRLIIAMMVLVSAVTILALYLAERNLAATIERELQRSFEAELATLHNTQELRHASLVERCRALVRKPRIHAALEDNALDLLYPSAEDELRDVMVPAGESENGEAHVPTLRARFYRFLDRTGRVIAAPPAAPVGALPKAVEAQLTLPSLNDTQQIGYIGPGNDVTEVIATPIISTETGEPIAALVLGFRPLGVGRGSDIQSGVWVGGKLHMPTLNEASAQRLAEELLKGAAGRDRGSSRVTVDGAAHLLFFQRLNPGSLYPPAYEVSIFALDRFAARRMQLRWRIIAVGGLLLAGAFLVTRLLSARLSAPVEKLAIDSERSARFSADASHQLKTPVTVLRAGLEELLTRDNLTPEECDALAALIHQTYRLSSLIDDLLLLSRMDSGRLKLTFSSVDLAHLIAAALDDLSATPDAMSLGIETEVPPSLHVAGESRYTAIILQNLLENARKYNLPGGRIRVAARTEGESVYLTIANTGRRIPEAAQAHIFERFHRGAMGENVPGYGLGLNLARELARLHDGELRLLRSDNEWTEFEVRFRRAQPATVTA